MRISLLKKFLSWLLVALTGIACAQSGGVSINNTNSPAHPSAMLDVSSTSAPYLGMLIPRMTTANRNSIISPAVGLMIYNTDCGINEYYTGTCWISTGQNLKAPDQITCSGTTDFCANETRTFTISPVTGATNYVWTVPPGATLSAGQGTTTAIVVFGNNSGDVCVTAGNLCETSWPRCIGIHINPVPSAPGNITGLTSVSPGSTTSYFIAAVAGAGLYNWTVPFGATIISGVGTTTITVSFSCSAVSGNISVTAQNNCGSSSASTLAITLTPVIANAGPGTTSPGTLGGSPTASGGATPYTYGWTPSTNLSSATVANPVTTVCTTTAYTVIVTDANGCTSRSSAIASAINPIPAAPGTIAGNGSVSCNTSGNVYSINSVLGASTYTWTVPSGASITFGQGTTSITVTFGTASGNISVTAGNNCGTSAASTLAITVIGTSSGSQTLTASGSGRTGTIQTFTVPSCITSITIDAYGSQGADEYINLGGKGARIKGTFAVAPGQVLQVLVGQHATNLPSSPPNSRRSAGGGGASFVVSGTTPLIVAGGGGGASSMVHAGIDGSTSTNGNNGQDGSGVGGVGGSGGTQGNSAGGAGGAGWNSNGSDGNSWTNSGGKTFLNGGAGGTGNTANGVTNYGTDGGYGGGGGGWAGGGGGGGYSGGGGGQWNGDTTSSAGGGGGSYNSGTNQTNTAGVQSGTGQVIISW